ncbi:hypothetical protein [Agrobacterium rosae]|uniref:hypothetical protein n=1 Tax=Agrobacterium rosae TaxID=1972867 RepID=UPI003BA1DCA5
MAAKRIITSDEFADEYPRVREWLKAALAYQIGGGDEKALLDGLAEKRLQLWVSDDAACVTEITTVDGTKVCLLYLVAGEHGKAMEQILSDGQTAVEDWAKTKRCKGFYGIGRPEWKRVLAPHGFEVQSVNYYKEF